MNEKSPLEETDLSYIIDSCLMLALEYDIPKLLEKILHIARKMTCSDAGSIYVVERSHEEEKGEKRQLRFKAAQNDTVHADWQEFVFDIDKRTIAGYVASTGEIVTIDDVYSIPKDFPFSFGKGVDEKTGYRTSSMLAFPMKNFRQEVIGVVQLINRKERFDKKLEKEKITGNVLPYDQNYRRLASFMVAQAGSALENASLVDSIKESYRAQERLQKEKIVAFYDIAAGLSDTLINKLSGILMSLQYLQEGLRGLGKEGEEFTSMNHDAILEAQWVIKMVKRFQETTDLALMSTTDDLDLHSVLKEIELEYKGKKPAFQLFDGTPIVSCNPQIGECFKGIIENALESRMDGQADVSVRTRPGPSSETVLIEITDNGKGMSQDQAQRAFTPFYTSKGTTRSGLGLWYCYQLVNGSGGNISIKSRPGAGTTVTISLPASKTKEAGPGG